ncbi:TadE/TadG family type IV pilus assembly protein [Taklimakanibacter deserti]|uniref:TadE/TadG family type IV pilus assembly protein n=1 Tax=Taklimakanibacter deserti TaxID=2267839 RepID=UPI000E657277
MAWLGKIRKDTRGVAAIEFALVAPVFFLLLLGIAAYGIYFSAISSLQELTADAARASVAGVSDTERQTIVSSYVAQSSPNYQLLSRHPITVTATPYPGDPTRYTVTLRTDISNLPLQGTTGLFPMPSAIIQRTAVVRIGGY